ncbi:MAG: lipopolysaccharide biosynthesis protein [Oscillospiraceae bacterium]|jgi:O-antigen/teichoic acid export membrane protein
MSGFPAKLRLIFHDHLYRNSVFMVLGRLLNVTSGFLFWLIAASLYSIAYVGNATALISSLGLVMIFSRLGFDISLVRFIDSDKSRAFNTSLAITTAASVVISILYVLLVKLIQPSLVFNLFSGLMFVLAAVFNSITLITGNMFLALRKGQHYLLQTLLTSVRLILLFPLAALKDFGIFLSLGTCYVLSSVVSLYLLRKEIKISFTGADSSYLKKSISFSVKNYLSGILNEAPILLLPILVLNLIGREAAAKYYIAMSLGNLVLIIPHALSFSLFVEGSRGQPLKQNVVKACLSAFLFLIPLSAFIGLCGKYILNFLSAEYAGAYTMLLLITFSSFFVFIYLLYSTVQNIRLRVGTNIIISAVRFVLIIAGSCLLAPGYKINGVGYAWLMAHVILSLIIASAFIKTEAGKLIKRIASKRGKAQLSALTTGPVVRDLFARSLVVVVMNTAGSDLEVKVIVNDLKEGRRIRTEKSLIVKSSFTRYLCLPNPPDLYEVLIEGIAPGVYVWTSTSAYCSPLMQKNKFIEANTYRHNDFIRVLNNEAGNA